MRLGSITDAFGHMKNTNKSYIVHDFIFIVFLEGESQMPGEMKEEGLTTKGHGNQCLGGLERCSGEIVLCFDYTDGYITVYICQNLQNLTKIDFQCSIHISMKKETCENLVKNSHKANSMI